MSTEEPTRRAPARQLIRDLAVSAAVALVVVLAMHGLQRQSQRGGGGMLPVGSPAPAFELRDVRTGEEVALDDLRGRPVLLSFWATWCGPCMGELPELERLHRRAGDRFHMVTVNGEAPSRVRGEIRRRGLTLPVLHDPGGRVQAAYRVERIPTTVILDGEGRVVHDFVGEADPDILLEHVERLWAQGTRG